MSGFPPQYVHNCYVSSWNPTAINLHRQLLWLLYPSKNCTESYITDWAAFVCKILTKFPFKGLFVPIPLLSDRGEKKVPRRLSPTLWSQQWLGKDTSQGFRKTITPSTVFPISTEPDPFLVIFQELNKELEPYFMQRFLQISFSAIKWDRNLKTEIKSKNIHEDRCPRTHTYPFIWGRVQDNIYK